MANGCLRICVYGAIGGFLHFALGFVLALYFGLGMSRTGSWFVTNVWAQPGRSLVAAANCLGFQEQSSYVLAIIVNFSFYSILTGAVVWFWQRHFRA
jgi:hypothetical protein